MYGPSPLVKCNALVDYQLDAQSRRNERSPSLKRANCHGSQLYFWLRRHELRRYKIVTPNLEASIIPLISMLPRISEYCLAILTCIRHGLPMWAWVAHQLAPIKRTKQREAMK